MVQGAINRGLKGRCLRFIKSFSEDRTYEVVAGEEHGPKKENVIGVPQGAVLSPMLFNMVMADLAFALEKVEGLGHSIYADDITTWLNERDVKEQKEILQEGLDTIHSFLQRVGMRLSPDKTNCVTVANKRGRKENGTCDKIHLSVNGTPIQRTDSVKILGGTFQEDGRASKWYRGIKNH